MKKKNKLTIPEAQLEPYITDTNNNFGSSLGVIKDSALTVKTSLHDLAKEYELFTPVIFYKLFRSAQNPEPLGSIIGSDIPIIKTSILPKKVIEGSYKGDPEEKEDYIIYGVVKEKYPRFHKTLSTALCTDTPHKAAFAIDIADVKVPDLEGSYIIIKYIKVIGIYETYDFEPPELTIGNLSPPKIRISTTPKSIGDKLQLLFVDPSQIYYPNKEEKE